MSEFAKVGNAADRDQVEKADKAEKRGRAREIEELQGLLQLPAFQRFYWRALDRASVFTSVYDPSAIKMAFNSGQQDFGHWLLAELDAAKPEALIEMMQRAKKEKP